jgi:HAD superfamily hydrolase (TIGR01459 family)
MTSASAGLSGQTTVIPGLSALAAQYDVLLCDVWGVVHNGKRSYERACDALMRFRAGGGTVVLITNAPRPNPPIRAQLDLLKVPREAFDDMVTSGDVTLSFIAERKAAPLYHIGPERDLALFDILEQQTGIRPPLVSVEAADYVVVTGLFNDQVETPEDYDVSLAVMRRRDLDMISANPDLVVHVGEKLIYCSGALAERYEQQGGRILQAGKPFRPIYDRALSIAETLRSGSIDKARVLAIGDAMRTDIQGASDFGVDALFVTSGIHRDELHPDSELDEAALRQFVGMATAKPKAAIAELVW